MTRLLGAVQLQAHLDSLGVSRNVWAHRHGIDPSELSKLVRGVRVRVSVETAAKIQAATKGAVQWRAWIP